MRTSLFDKNNCNIFALFVRDFSRQKARFEKLPTVGGLAPSTSSGQAVQAGGPFDYVQGRLSAGRVEVRGIPHLAR